MFNLLTSREEIGVTKINVITMIWLAFVASMCLGWQGTFMVYLFEN